MACFKILKVLKGYSLPFSRLEKGWGRVMSLSSLGKAWAIKFWRRVNGLFQDFEGTKRLFLAIFEIGEGLGKGYVPIKFGEGLGYKILAEGKWPVSRF